MRTKYSADYDILDLNDKVSKLRLEIYNQVAPFRRALVVVFPNFSVKKKTADFSSALSRPYYEPLIPFTSAHFTEKQMKVLEAIVEKIFNSKKVQNRRSGYSRGKFEVRLDMGYDNTPSSGDYSNPPRIHISRYESTRIEEIALEDKPEDF